MKYFNILRLKYLTRRYFHLYTRYGLPEYFESNIFEYSSLAGPNVSVYWCLNTGYNLRTQD